MNPLHVEAQELLARNREMLVEAEALMKRVEEIRSNLCGTFLMAGMYAMPESARYANSAADLTADLSKAFADLSTVYSACVPNIKRTAEVALLAHHENKNATNKN